MTAPAKYDRINCISRGRGPAAPGDSRGRASGAGFAWTAASSDQVAAGLDHAGLAVLADVIPDEWLLQARAYANGVQAGHEIMIEGDEALELSFLRTLESDPQLRSLLERLAHTTLPMASAEDGPLECSLRVIRGADPLERPLWFHYDASMLSVVIPVEIPDGAPGQSGELVLCPNRRAFRRLALTNVIEKAIVQSNAYRRRFQRRWHRTQFSVVPLRPGNAYIFSGYRSYHATMPVAPDASRVTVILHFRNVHGDSRLLRNAKSVRRRMRR